VVDELSVLDVVVDVVVLVEMASTADCMLEAACVTSGAKSVDEASVAE